MKNLVIQALRRRNRRARASFHASNENADATPHEASCLGVACAAPDFGRRFLIDARLGQASSFEIYACTDPRTDDTVTVKVLRIDKTSAHGNALQDEVRRLIQLGAEAGLCLSSQGETQVGPYYAINGDRDAALAFMLNA